MPYLWIPIKFSLNIVYFHKSFLVLPKNHDKSAEVLSLVLKNNFLLY